MVTRGLRGLTSTFWHSEKSEILGVGKGDGEGGDNHDKDLLGLIIQLVQDSLKPLYKKNLDRVTDKSFRRLTPVSNKESTSWRQWKSMKGWKPVRRDKK